MYSLHFSRCTSTGENQIIQKLCSALLSQLLLNCLKQLMQNCQKIITHKSVNLTANTLLLGGGASQFNLMYTLSHNDTIILLGSYRLHSSILLLTNSDWCLQWSPSLHSNLYHLPLHQPPQSLSSVHFVQYKTKLLSRYCTEMKPSRMQTCAASIPTASPGGTNAR